MKKIKIKNYIDFKRLFSDILSGIVEIVVFVVLLKILGAL